MHLLPEHLFLLIVIGRDFKVFQSAAGRIDGLFVWVRDLVNWSLIDSSFEQDGLRRRSRADGRLATEQQQKSLISVVMQEVSHFQRIADRIEAQHSARGGLEELRCQSVRLVKGGRSRVAGEGAGGRSEWTKDRSLKGDVKNLSAKQRNERKKCTSND